MSKILIVGDTHIDEESISEINAIFEKDILPIKTDIIIQLGDFYEKNSPTPAELEFGTELITKLKNKHKKVIILSGTGKHDWKNQVSVVSYLKHLKVEIPGITYNLEIDNKKIFFAHWMLKQSKLEYGTGKCGTKELKDKYDFVLLGHQHSFQELLKDRIFHLGSIRFCNFNEVGDPYKQIAILENGVLTFIPLKSPTPMIQLVTEDCPHYLEEQLPKINPRSKVKVKFSTFFAFKNSLETIKKYKDKFVEFKVKLDFEKDLTKAMVTKKEKNNLDEIVLGEIRKIKDKDVRELLEAQFKEN